MKTLRVVMTSMLICCFAFSYASANSSRKNSENGQTIGQKIEDSFIDSNVIVSKWINTAAEGLDLWLAGQQYTSEKNETYATVSGAVYHNKINGTKNDVAFDVSLRLPNVEEYWLLTFTSYDDSTENGVSQNYFRTAPRERDYGASVGLMALLGKVKTRFQPRISFDGFTEISNTLTFESILEEDDYKVNPRLKFYAEPDVGTGTFFALNFNRSITAIYSFTLINEGDYRDRERALRVTNGFSVGQWFSEKSSIAYNVFVNSISRPNYQLSSYSFSTSWSHILYRRILDYQVVPNLVFSAEENYRVNPGINLIVNLRF